MKQTWLQVQRKKVFERNDNLLFYLFLRLCSTNRWMKVGLILSRHSICTAWPQLTCTLIWVRWSSRKIFFSLFPPLFSRKWQDFFFRSYHRCSTCILLQLPYCFYFFEQKLLQNKLFVETNEKNVQGLISFWTASDLLVLQDTLCELMQRNTSSHPGIFPRSTLAEFNRRPGALWIKYLGPHWQTLICIQASQSLGSDSRDVAFRKDWPFDR